MLLKDLLVMREYLLCNRPVIILLDKSKKNLSGKVDEFFRGTAIPLI